MTRKLHPAAEQLLAEIEAYRALSGLNRTDFGLMSANNGHLISRMERGSTPTLETIDKVRAFIARETKAVRRRA
jgi:hypothetical protein